VVAGYRPETGCAASAERRGDLLLASAPPAERWLLIECRDPWPRTALTALRRQPPTAKSADRPPIPGDRQSANEVPGDPGSLAAEVSRLCVAGRYRPVLIRRHGRIDKTAPRQWALVDSRPGFESVRWGELPTDEHLLDVLAGKDQGTPSTEPIYLVCTHGRHDACCAVRGRPAAAALSAAFPDRTWECSHVGGDRFAANLVFLPHSLFYGHVPADEAVELAHAYDKGLLVPEFLRGSGALNPPVQAAQHFARAATVSLEGDNAATALAVDALRPISVRELAPNRWQVALDHHGRQITVEVAAQMITVDGAMTCAAVPPGRARQFTLVNSVDLAEPGTTSPSGSVVGE